MSQQEMIEKMLLYVQPSYWRVKELSNIGVNADNFCEVDEPKTNIIAGVARYPIKSGVTMIFPKIATIDFRYSGSGNDTSQTWGDLSQEGSIGVVFDKLGCLDALVKQKPVSYIDPFEIVYFFIVNRRDMISNKGLSITDAFWVAIQPNTGQVVVANHIPQENNNNDSLIASRENARKSFNIGGR